MYESEASSTQKIAVQRLRYTTLDAMRGVAAVVVVLFHLHLYQLLPFDVSFGYLAVDLFFGLSGFVLAQNYDSRFDAGLTAREFMLRRVIRLFPIFLIGFGLGEILRVAAVMHHELTAQQFGATTLLNLLLLPALVDNPSTANFPADGPAWSLFLELWIANLVYATFWRPMRGAVTWAVAAISGALLLVTIVHYGDANGGPETSQIVRGVIRVMFSFFAGVTISRIRQNAIPTLTLPTPTIPALLVLLLIFPIAGTIARNAYEIGCIFVLFPAMLYLGAKVTEQTPSIGTMLGDASYVLYVIHVPLIDISEHILWRVEPVEPLSPLLGLVIAPTVVAVALWMHRRVDGPMQRWAKRALLSG